MLAADRLDTGVQFPPAPFPLAATGGNWKHVLRPMVSHRPSRTARPVRLPRRSVRLCPALMAIRHTSRWIGLLLVVLSQLLAVAGGAQFIQFCTPTQAAVSLPEVTVLCEGRTPAAQTPTPDAGNGAVSAHNCDHDSIDGDLLRQRREPPHQASVPTILPPVPALASATCAHLRHERPPLISPLASPRVSLHLRL